MSPVNTDTSFIENRAPNVAVQFRDRVAKSPGNEAYRFPVGASEQWESWTWAETGEKVEKLAAGLLALGLEPEQRVGIAAGTRVEWILADLASCAPAARPRRCIRRRTVRTSPTSSPTPSAASSSPRTTSQLDKLREHKSELPHLEQGGASSTLRPAPEPTTTTG